MASCWFERQKERTGNFLKRRKIIPFALEVGVGVAKERERREEQFVFLLLGIGEISLEGEESIKKGQKRVQREGFFFLLMVHGEDKRGNLSCNSFFC